MNQVLKDAISYLAALLAKLGTPAIERWLSDWSASLFADSPAIGGAWVVEFFEPTPEGSATRRIDATIRQFGRRIEGVGHLQGEPGDPFEYRGHVKRNVFYGVFHRKNRRVLAGTGTFVLKVAADSQTLEGVCSWYDSDLDEVWSSHYGWRR